MSKQEMKPVKRGELHKVLPETLHEKKGFNVRQDMGDIDGLKDSIVEVGVKQPLKVRPMEGENEKFIVIDGHRRMAAIKKALEEGKEVGYVPVTKADKHSNEEDDVFDLILQNDGKNLTLLEQGEVFKRLKDKHYEIGEIASRIGKSRSHITNGLMLSSAPKEIKEYINKGQVASSTVLELLRKVDDPEQQKEMIENAIVEKEIKAESETEPSSGSESTGDEGKKESGGSSKSKTSSTKKGGSKGGKKTKASKKEVLGEKDPIKTLEKVEKEVKGVEFDHTKTALLKDLKKALKKGQSVEEIVELFKKEDKRTTVGKAEKETADKG